MISLVVSGSLIGPPDRSGGCRSGSGALSTPRSGSSVAGCPAPSRRPASPAAPPAARGPLSVAPDSCVSYLPRNVGGVHRLLVSRAVGTAILDLQVLVAPLAARVVEGATFARVVDAS